MAVLFVHGKMGCKEEAVPFYENMSGRVSVVALDLPAHGERKNRGETLTPWAAVPEILAVYEWMKTRFPRISVRANSVGAYFSMPALEKEPIEKALFVSPVTDMQKLIENMMAWATVTKDELREKREIPTAFGETLSWDYYAWVKAHPIVWNAPTEVLYGSNDNLISQEMISAFMQGKNRRLTVMEGGEHWFHTEEQLAFMKAWERNVLSESQK